MKDLMMTGASPYHTVVPDLSCCLDEDRYIQEVMSRSLGGPTQTAAPGHHGGGLPAALCTAAPDSASDCSSEHEDKVYTSLSTGTRSGAGGNKGRSPLSQLQVVPPQEKYLSTESIDMKSWRERHPRHWRTQDIINWVYFVCSRSGFDSYSVSAEKFNTLKGDDLCSMTRDDFIDRDLRYGARLHDCFQQLLKKAVFKAPTDIDMCLCMDDPVFTEAGSRHPFSLSDNSTMWSSTVPPDESDQEMDLGVCSPSIMAFESRPLELDPPLPGTGIAFIGTNGYDYMSDEGFEDIPQCDFSGGDSSGYGSDGSSSCTSYNNIHQLTPPPAHSHHPQHHSLSLSSQPSSSVFSFPTPPHHHPHAQTHPHTQHQQQQHQHPHSSPLPQSPQPLTTSRPAHAPTEVTHPMTYAQSYTSLASLATSPAALVAKTVAPVKKRGRPKHDGTSTPGQRGRKQGQTTKGNHLWEFIRDTINDHRYNPDYIKWENKEQGIFRIVNSAEIAKMWGRTKNNTSMTYEKFSRAMRFCRTQEFFADLPKEGNYPKKLCFRFGAKATHWAQ